MNKIFQFTFLANGPEFSNFSKMNPRFCGLALQWIEPRHSLIWGKRSPKQELDTLSLSCANSLKITCHQTIHSIRTVS